MGFFVQFVCVFVRLDVLSIESVFYMCSGTWSGVVSWALGVLLGILLLMCSYTGPRTVHLFTVHLVCVLFFMRFVFMRSSMDSVCLLGPRAVRRIIVVRTFSPTRTSFVHFVCLLCFLLSF